MLRKRKEPKAKKSVTDTLLRDMQGTTAEKLAAFEKLRARGAFDGMDRPTRKRRGYVTFEEANRILPESEVSAAGIEAMVEAIYNLGFELRQS